MSTGAPQRDMVDDLFAATKGTGQFLLAMKRIAQYLQMLLPAGTAVIAEVFLRYRIGERYLGPMRLFLGFVTMVTIGRLTGEGPTMTVLILAWVFAVLMQRVAAIDRAQKGNLWHSRSSGLSQLCRLPFFKSTTLVIVTEASLCIGVAIFVIPMSQALAWTFGLAGAGIAIKSLLEYMVFRDKILDAIDSQLESQMMSYALEGATPQETSGFAVPGAKRMSKQVRSVADALDDLDPELAALINTPDATIEPKPVPAEAVARTD